MLTDCLWQQADVNAQDSGGYTALMMGAEAGAMAAVEKLMQHGADAGLKTVDGWLCGLIRLDTCRGKTAAELARATGLSQVVKLLTQHTK
jgi:ankyrin repeat protein